ncbi:phenylalanine--tRNA ligase subunit beta [Mycoplasma putrefaciens]|uniref:phenylalanine--tRNA ligase subunit beta n=1 Tax=Mycoplasma putrefaciens TaxID=2123 RepID=UPI003DA4BF4F
MIITRKWLAQFLDLENISNDQISLALNSLGFEVEQTYDLDALNSELLLGLVVESKPIANTHLKINKVKLADQILEIVCGAENIGVDQFVIVAPINSTISNGLTLTAKTIRGYQSQGMVCALNEIGIFSSSLTESELKNIYQVSDNHLNLNTLTGQSVKPMINLDDFIWEVDLTLNRSDCLASFQLLKELANYFNLSITNLNSEFNHFTNNDLKLTVEIDPKLEQFIRTVAYSEYQLKKSVKLNSKDDLWLKLNHTKTTGDIINDLALKTAIQTGQNLIVIDQNKLKDFNLEIKQVRWNDLEVLAVVSNDQIINVIGLEVEEHFRADNNSQNIVVLMLNLDPTIMRKQQKLLNTSTIMLQRYTKPINPNLFELANKTFANELDYYNLVNKASQVKILKKTFEQNNKFVVDLDRINTLLGTKFSVSEIQALFKTLDFKITANDQQLTFEVDENRIDLYGVNDICEEIARLYGYDQIKEQPIDFKTNKVDNKFDLKLEDKLTNYLIGLGFNNTKTYSLTDHQSAVNWNLFKIQNLITLEKPLSKLRTTYRTNLSKSLIDTAIYNAANNNKQLKLFEIADIYGFKELKQRHLAFLTTSDIFQDKLSDNKISANFYYNKAILEAIFRLYNLDLNKLEYQINQQQIDQIHAFVNATIKYDQHLLGFIYRLNPDFEAQHKLEQTIVVEINLDNLNKFANKTIQIATLSKYQSSKRDVSIELVNDIKYSDFIKKIIKNVKYLTNVQVIDQYVDQKLASENKKSLTIQFTFNSFDHQLTEQEINDQQKILQKNILDLEITIR